MVAAAAKIKIPVFLLQAENDLSTGPTTTIDAEFTRLGKPHKAVIYPHFTSSIPNYPKDQEGHRICGEGEKIWAADVFVYISAALR